MFLHLHLIEAAMPQGGYVEFLGLKNGYLHKALCFKIEKTMKSQRKIPR